MGNEDTPCALFGVALEARQAFPAPFFERHPFAIVRRGVVFRHRIDAQGRRTVVDVAGPGCLLPLQDSSGAETAGAYAVTRALLCLPSSEEAGWNDLPAETAAELLPLFRSTLNRVEALAAVRLRASAVDRVVALIELLAETLPRPPGGVRWDRALSQRDMAELLGMRPETVCRALRTIEREGLRGAGPY